MKRLIKKGPVVIVLSVLVIAGSNHRASQDELIDRLIDKVME